MIAHACYQIAMFILRRQLARVKQAAGLGWSVESLRWVL
jgi:hypothetical protein